MAMVKQIMSQSPITFAVQYFYFMVFFHLIVNFVSGIGMLKGWNWSRFLYIIWSVISFIIGMFTSPFKIMMIPGILIFFVAAFFLLSPKANKFFQPDAEETS